jgi:DNA primase
MNDDNGLIFDILTQILGYPRTHYESKCQASWNCPVCDENRGKANFEVNYRKGVYKCWACEETNNTHGSIFKLIKTWGNKDQLSNYLLIRPYITKQTDKEEDPKEFTGLPKEFIKFSESNPSSIYHKQAYQYITQNRGITDTILEKYNIGYCHEGKYRNRIIIPSHDKEGYVDYFSARSWLKIKMKYDNPEFPKEQIIFNEFYIDWDKDVYLVEGALDHIVVENSIPMLGKKLSDLLWNTLYDNAKANVIIAVDPDAMDMVKKLYKQLNGGKLHGRIRALMYKSEHDLCELHKRLPKDQFQQLLSSSIQIRESKL